MNIDIPTFNKNYDSAQLIFVGADFDRHGAPTALRILRKVHEVRPDINMLFVGKCLGTEYPYIKSYKHVAHNILQDLLRDSSVLIMPSVMGGMQTIAEAMANKCVPIVADKNPYVRDVIVNGISGVLVAEDDVNGWIEAIMKIMDERKYRINLMDGCSQVAMERLTWRMAILRIRDEIEASYNNT